MSTLQKLKARHREIARLLITGVTETDIAQKLGMSPEGVRHATRSPLFQQLFGELTAEADSEITKFRKELIGLLPDALAVQKNILTNAQIEVSLKQKSAWDVFDRVGIVAPKEVHFEGNITHSTEELSDADLLNQIEQVNEQLKSLTTEETPREEPVSKEGLGTETLG